jgi:hypothetical protein
MSDIFISYASEERDRVIPLVSALEKTGWSVFWDRTIPAGRTWRRIIGSEIQTCRSVLVVWTENSITSEWVLEEAETGKRRGILIPVLLDDVQPPFGFGNIQAANLVAWNGDTSSPTFAHLVADIATILGTTPTALKEAGKHRPLDAELRRKAEEEHVRQLLRQRSERQAQRKAEEENHSRIELETNRAHTRPERQDASVPGRRAGLDKRRLYAGGAMVVVIGAAIAFWFLGPFGTKDADVKTIVWLAIQGKRQLNVGEKTVLWVGGRFSDGSETEVTRNLDWHSSDDSVVAVSRDGQVEARKDGFADITVRYERMASPPLTVVVRGESRSPQADAAQVAIKVQEHIKTAGSYRDRGEYSTGLAELVKAKSLDPANKAVQGELESTKKACLAEQRIVLTSLRCD